MADARRAVAATATAPAGDLAGLATALVGLQALLGSAQSTVANDQGAQLLEAIDSQVLAMGAAFPVQAVQGALGAPGSGQ
eukprot:3707745-Pyramimonas_sp.AAC.1